MMRSIQRYEHTRKSLSAVTAVVFFWASTVSVIAQPPGLPTPSAPGVPRTATPAGGDASSRLILLNFRDSPLDQVLDFVAELRGKTMIKAPGINATITIKSQTRLTEEEALVALESVLAMNNITLVPLGDKFLKVVQTAQARQTGMPIQLGLTDPPFVETDALISQIITLQHIEIAEAQGVIQGLVNAYGKIQPLERANSMLITDTEVNLERIKEILAFIDQPIETKIETRIYEIRHAKAGEIASRLNELIADSQGQEEKEQINVQQTQAPGTPQIPTPPGVIRARQAQQQAQAGSEIEAAMQLAERGVIQGKVKIIADERTNILFVISRPENFTFFDKIVSVLDRPVEPEITVRVVALEYAKAEDISSILNEFIGAATEQDTSGAPAGTGGGDSGATDARSQALREFIRNRAAERTATQDTGDTGTIGRLSEDTQILADKRTNSLLLMGRQSDLNVLEDIIDNLDIMLAQVVIEAVIIEVQLSDDIQSGVSWLQNTLVAYNAQNVGPGGGLTVREPVVAFGGASIQTPDKPLGEKIVDDLTDTVPDGLAYYATFYDLNLSAVVRFIQSSRNSRILSTPVVVTTDNTEAKINASTQRPVVTTTSTTDAGAIRSSYEYRDIGIQLTVTPRINPQRYVVMEIVQSADNVAGEVLIDGNRVPEITKRELSAQIAVEDRSTIVLGGLVLTQTQKSQSKVPLLGDIPVLGNLFKYTTDVKDRVELVVLITPYVLMTPEEARAESMRMVSSSSFQQRDFPKGWSDSEVGELTDQQRKQYLENWDEMRPDPYSRERSVNLYSTGDSPTRSEILVPATSGRRETLMDKLRRGESGPASMSIDEVDVSADQASQLMEDDEVLPEAPEASSLDPDAGEIAAPAVSANLPLPTPYVGEDDGPSP
ncbi:MAG: type II secretion system secretin GspD [Verrucomicrobia bacterium]|nr:type II secretion system secretin GspD [Verrucomicrobiota bacterium]